MVADGICDALVLLFFEKQMDEGKRSEKWMVRQQREVNGGLKALAEGVGNDRRYFLGDTFGLVDIAAGSVLGYMKVRFPEHPWRKRYPHLAEYSKMLEERQSFKDTVPRLQQINDKFV